ncbi:MAG: hypothetical protein MK052_07105 [Alphaproteobacteria bacterium]|nr:hypothetical protein [Alphaproteobacteria bacterium]
MPNNNPSQNNPKDSANLDQQRKSQRMEEGSRTGKGDINEDKRNQNNPNQPR